MVFKWNVVAVICKKIFKTWLWKIKVAKLSTFSSPMVQMGSKSIQSWIWVFFPILRFCEMYYFRIQSHKSIFSSYWRNWNVPWYFFEILTGAFRGCYGQRTFAVECFWPDLFFIALERLILRQWCFIRGLFCISCQQLLTTHKN